MSGSYLFIQVNGGGGEEGDLYRPIKWTYHLRLPLHTFLRNLVPIANHLLLKELGHKWDQYPIRLFIELLDRIY